MGVKVARADAEAGRLKDVKWLEKPWGWVELCVEHGTPADIGQITTKCITWSVVVIDEVGKSRHWDVTCEGAALEVDHGRVGFGGAVELDECETAFADDFEFWRAAAQLPFHFASEIAACFAQRYG